ncbi:hypothetical protein [Dactylosporangium sp. NPDC048998]
MNVEPLEMIDWTYGGVLVVVVVVLFAPIAPLLTTYLDCHST